MMNRQQRNVTYIDDLPELSELTSDDDIMMLSSPPNNSMLMNKSQFPSEDKYKKYIRNSNNQPKQFNESGMVPMSQSQLNSNNISQQPRQSRHSPPQLEDDDMFFQQHPPQTLYGSPNCIDVANHINSCPICSKLYNNDKTMYVLCIIILAIICLILMKKCLNV